MNVVINDFAVTFLEIFEDNHKILENFQVIKAKFSIMYRFSYFSYETS